MIDTLLNKLGGLLEKHFMFSALLPVILIIGGNFLIAALAIGFKDCLRWFAALEISHQSLLSAAFFVVAFILAYVVSSLRGSILKLWCNVYVPWLREYLYKAHQERYRRLRRKGLETNPWDGLDEVLAEAVDPHWEINGRNKLDRHGEERCQDVIEDLAMQRTPDSFRDNLQRIIDIFGEYDGEDLTGFYGQIRRFLIDSREENAYRIQSYRRQLDLTYGSWGSIRPTRLGNIVEAYNRYPYSRYNIDGELLWPRLVQVTPDAFNEILQDKKAFLDFALAMASGLLISAFAVSVYGPLLWSDAAALLVWPLVSLASILAIYPFYKTAIMAARDFGDTLRSACDLFRLDLMNALQRPRPPDLATERGQWNELGQLMAYGTISNFELRPEDDDAP